MSIESKKTFISCYHENPVSHYFAPGRVNLIGEYTDIAGGHVLPMAIQLGIDASVSPQSDRTINIFSLGDQVSFQLDNLVKQKNQWVNYVIGVFYTIASHGYKFAHGLNIALASDLPTASGLSSSAAIEVLIGTIINEEYSLKIEDLDIVKYAKETENKFIGLNSGIMDQFACKMGRKDMAIYLDTKSLKSAYVPFNLGAYNLIIMNTNKSRTLSDSKYNQRVIEMKEGLDALRPYVKFEDACSISQADFEKYATMIKNHDAVKRLRHLIGEDARVNKAVEVLRNNDILAFCTLLNASHKSLRYDFEVSGRELDTLVDEAIKAGALGARMTGAGFGGCGIFVCHKPDTDKIIKTVGEEYYKKIGYHADFYPAIPTDGTRKIQ